MNPISARPYDKPSDLRLMQDLVAEAWALEGAPQERHVGDLAWTRYQHTGKEDEWKLRLWEREDGRLAAWAWLVLPGTLDFQVHPELRGGEVHDEVLDWLAAEAEADELTASALDRDTASVEVLRRHGYREAEPEFPFVHLLRDLDEPIDEPVVPDGYELRSVRGPDDLERRVEVHRAAFHPSRVTTESYANAMRAWPYRAELDCVAEASDGSFASYCLVWLDERNGVGELEPVGTHPDHGRRGLASAVCRYALLRLAGGGARHAVVYARADAAYPVPRRLYESIGFRKVARLLEFRRTRA
jgi:ribosomal protein S18 acetylase RimI-like enzyme